MKDILLKARAKIAEPAHWCRGYYAKDILNRVCEHDYPGAVAFCAIGAMRNVEPDFNERCNAVDLLDKVSRRLFGHMLVWVNDNRDHEQVLQVFDTAIMEATAIEVNDAGSLKATNELLERVL